MKFEISLNNFGGFVSVVRIKDLFTGGK